MYSIRRRLLLINFLGFSVLILAAGWFLVRELGAGAVAEFDVALEAKLRALAALCEVEDGQIEFDHTPGAMPEFERERLPDHYQFWLDDGRVLLRSKQLAGDLSRTRADVRGVTFRDVTAPNGRAMRQAQLVLTPSDVHGRHDEDEDEEEGESGPSGLATQPEGAAQDEAAGPTQVPRGLILAVARGRERLDALLGTMRWTVLGTAGLAMLLAGLLAWRAGVAGLRPVDAIAAQVRELDADKLDSRVGLTPQPMELAPVIEQINALLARLGASFERERRFTGNVAHELRTPIAELRSLASVAAKWPDDKQAISGFFQDVQDVAKRMEGVIVDLLFLARCQAGVERVAPVSVPVESALQAAYAPLGSKAAARGLTLSVDVPPELCLWADPGKLDIALANLLGNAVSYARPGTAIRCRATSAGGAVAIEIRNEAEALEAKDLERLTEPFWRGDPARSSSHHAGLGLSLVEAIAGLLDVDVHFSQDAEGTFSVRLQGSIGSEGASRPRSVVHT